MRTDYLDLTLIHWPAPGNGVELSEYMEALAQAKAKGLTRQIGISNFNVELTRQAIGYKRRLQQIHRLIGSDPSGRIERDSAHQGRMHDISRLDDVAHDGTDHFTNRSAFEIEAARRS